MMFRKREANSGSESIFEAVGFLDAYDGGIPNGEQSGNGEGIGNGGFFFFFCDLDTPGAIRSA